MNIAGCFRLLKSYTLLDDIIIHKQHYAAAVRSASASRISEALDCVKSALKNVSPAKAKDLVGKYYEISTEEEHGPRWNTLSKQKASQELGGLTPSRIEALEADIFQHVSVCTCTCMHIHVAAV